MTDDHLLVDGMNVIGSRPDGWWRDRPGAVRRLAARLRRLAEAGGDPITVVFDGAPLDDLPEGEHGGVTVLYARRGGPDAADDRIVEIVAGRPDAFRVVTSDQALRQRVEMLSVPVEGVSDLLRRLDRIEANE